MDVAPFSPTQRMRVAAARSDGFENQARHRLLATAGRSALR
jgi:hypothetical protein